MLAPRDTIAGRLAEFGIKSALAAFIGLSIPTGAHAQTVVPATPVSQVAEPDEALVPAVTTPPVLAQSATPLDVYGLQTTVLTPLKPLAVEYSEAVFVRYHVGVDINAFRAGLTITPAAPVEVGYPFVNFGRMEFRLATVSYGSIGLRIRFVPGVVYTVTQPAFGISMKLGTRPLTAAMIPKPIRKVTDSPYYYGFLNHPWSSYGFLGGLVYASFGSKASPAELGYLVAARTTVRALVASGAGYVRMDFCGDQTIGHLAPYPVPNFTRYDAIISELAAVKITVLPEIQQHCAPKYDVFNQMGSGNQTYSTPEGYAKFASLVAKHLRKYPNVTRVELFNEPNLRGGWYPGTPKYADTDGSGAAPFMHAAYDAIKDANPKLMVVAGALASGGHHVDSRVFLNNAYLAGCRLNVCWDELSIHNYRWTTPSAATLSNDRNEDNRFDNYKGLQMVARAHGDPIPKIMLTEWGYSSCASLASVCYDSQVQALYLAQGLNLALADPTIDGITYVNIYNSTPDGSTNFWSETSLLNNDFTTKPGFGVFENFAVGSH